MSETNDPLDESPAIENDGVGDGQRLEYASLHEMKRATGLKTVATFGQAWEAHLAAGKLEEQGIECSIADENIVAAGGGLYTNMTGGIKLQVPAGDVERAMALLPRRVQSQIRICPFCKSSEIKLLEPTPGFQIMALFLLGLPYLFVEKRFYCMACTRVFLQSEAIEPKYDEPSSDDEADD